MRRLSCIVLLFILLCLLFGCNKSPPSSEVAIFEDEVVALTENPGAVPLNFLPEHPGLDIKSNSQADIDYSNKSNGYVMVRFKELTNIKIKAQVKGPSTTYTYNVIPNEWIAFPLSDGSGQYQVVVLRNITENKYAQVISVSFNVSLNNEFAPFLYSNQYVNFENEPNTIALATELVGNTGNDLQKIEAIYNYVTNNLTYDKNKAQTVKSGYLPDLDTVLSEKKGICFDYAALMAGMLRSQGMPCKLVVGYAGNAYHAWISVYSDEFGWIDGAIYFDGNTWHRLDPTFASTSNNSESIMAYIANDNNYTIKYLY